MRRPPVACCPLRPRRLCRRTRPPSSTAADGREARRPGGGGGAGSLTLTPDWPPRCALNLVAHQTGGQIARMGTVGAVLLGWYGGCAVPPLPARLTADRRHCPCVPPASRHLPWHRRARASSLPRPRPQSSLLPATAPRCRPPVHAPRPFRRPTALRALASPSATQHVTPGGRRCDGSLPCAGGRRSPAGS